MAKSKVKLNHAGMEKMLKSQPVRTMLTKRAMDVLTAARMDPHDDTGDYQRGLRIEQATTDRAVVRVVSGDWKGHILEARYGILSRALDAAGGSRNSGRADKLLDYTTKSGKKRKATKKQIENWTRGSR